MSPVASERAVVSALQKQAMTAAEFLAWDAGQTLRHEFVRGEVFMMAGGEDRNNTVARSAQQRCGPTLSRRPSSADQAADRSDTKPENKGSLSPRGR